MAKTKKSTKKSGMDQSTEVAINEMKGPVTLTTAQIVEPASADRFSHIPIPEFLKAEGALEKVAPTGFTPLIQFGDLKDWRPGTWTIARFLGVRENVGPNNSAMYDFEVTQDGKEFSPASLWGSTIFDNKFKLLAPRTGQWIYMQYLGVTETSRKQNPAKDFMLAIVSDKIIAQMGYGAKKE